MLPDTARQTKYSSDRARYSDALPGLNVTWQEKLFLSRLAASDLFEGFKWVAQYATSHFLQIVVATLQKLES